MMKRRSTWAAGALAVIIAAVAGPATAACNWGQNTVRVYNNAMTIVGVPVQTHVNWIVADSASGPENVPYGNTPNQRVYGVDYPLMVELSQFTGLDWYTLAKVDVFQSVTDFRFEYESENTRCPGITSLLTTISVTLSEGVAGKAVVGVTITPN